MVVLIWGEGQDDLPEPLISFFFKIFLGFVEISDAFEALKLSELLISLAPPRSKKIKKDEYLKYHINAYLQEMYILKGRLRSYATKLRRSYRKAAWKDQFIKVTNPLERVINESLENVISVRGSHVHESRYSDEDLNSLSDLTIISESNEFRIYDLNIQYVLSQEKWKRQIRENNQETKKLLDIYFSTLHQAIAPEGDILVP